MRNAARQSIGSFLLALGGLIGVAGQVALADSDVPPEEPATAEAEPDAKPAAGAARLSGPQVYNEVCVACHSPPGIGGAPALGDGDAWAARIDQGMDTLIDHALNGFSGRTGIMPRKGGRYDLADEEIIAAIEFMVEQVAR